ncbi:MAG: hypothetical protein AAGH15_27645 [Myxococcota bacterium]
MSRKRRSRSSFIAIRRPEAPRDQGETAFTPLLRAFFKAAPQVLAVSFADSEGETIDYCSTLPPFDAKIAGAQLRATLNEVVGAVLRVGLGRAHALELRGEQRDIVVRDMGDGYLMAVLAVGGSTDQHLVDRAEELVAKLREEAAIVAPSWDPAGEDLRVTVRASVGWEAAPAAYAKGDETIALEVLGRWEESGGLTGGMLQCFRVREPDGAELTLAFDRVLGRWFRWGR